MVARLFKPHHVSRGIQTVLAHKTLNSRNVVESLLLMQRGTKYKPFPPTVGRNPCIKLESLIIFLLRNWRKIPQGRHCAYYCPFLFSKKPRLLDSGHMCIWKTNKQLLSINIYVIIEYWLSLSYNEFGLILNVWWENKGACKKNCILSGSVRYGLRTTPPPSCQRSLDFIQVFFTYIYIYMCLKRTRKAWNGWFWRKKTLVLKEKFQYIRKIF